jgi:hypothetical protein
MHDALALDEHRISYYRAVADFADMVGRGADLHLLVDRAEYVINPQLAALVPLLSNVKPQFSMDELRDLVNHPDGSATVRALVDVGLARHCLRHDVITCVAHYFDKDIARAWAAEVAATDLFPFSA